MRKSFWGILCGLLVALTTIGGRAETFETFAFEQNGISVSVDPRIELYNILNMLVGIPTINARPVTYKERIFTHFLPYRDHTAVKLFKECRYRGWGVDGPVFYMLHLDADFNLSPSLPEGIARGGGGLEAVQNLAAALKLFVRDTQFIKFFNDQREFYQLVIANTRYSFEGFDERVRLEKYYGQQNEHYRIILNLLEDNGNFGTNLKTATGTHCYAVICSSKAAQDIPVFAPSFQLYNLIFHEFSHSFVNPLSETHSAELVAEARLLEPIKQSMQHQAYQSWWTVANEHLVRAVTVRLAADKFGEAVAEKIYLKGEMGRRFIYVRALCEKLKHYEQNRAKYKTLAEFYPELIACFKAFDDAAIAQAQAEVTAARQPAIDRIPKPSDLKYDTNTVFIVSTHEKTEAGQRTVTEYANRLRDMINREMRIVKDDEALSMDLSGNDLVVFGTPTGNSYLQKHIASLPLIITETEIATSRVLSGQHWQLVAAWINPQNPERQMVIHTSQQAEDINNYNHSYHKEGSHYWIGQNLITMDSGDFQRVGEIWFPNLF